MRVLILTGRSSSLVNLRGDLIKELIRRSHEVVASSSDCDYANTIESYGVKYIQNSCRRNGIDPFSDIRFCIEIIRIIKHENIELVYLSTIKQVIYGSIAASFCGMKNIYSLITGRGYVFIVSGPRNFLIKFFTKKLYKYALKRNEKVFFQNPDDRNFFVSNRLVESKKSIVVNGSGVNMERFNKKRVSNTNVFLCIARLVKDKGVNEYLEAAKRVKIEYPGVEFHLVGGFDTNPNCISKQLLDYYVDNKFITYHGSQQDVRPFIENCFAFVLPSYAEGTPRTVLEAMSIGRAIITTDAPGCKETVKNGVNGFLVPIKDISALVEKIIWMIKNPEEVILMGAESRRYAEERYDVNKVNQSIIDSMKL